MSPILEAASPDAVPSVLVVDDVQANLVAMSALLEQMRCQVVLARSGDDALRLMLKRRFAVLLLDVQMPGMDGYEVAQHARRNPATRDVPIIFLTATRDTEDNVLRGYGSGAVDFLFKPINSAILRSKVNVFLELANGRQQLANAKMQLEARNRELRELADAKVLLAEQFQTANVDLKKAYRALQDTQAQLIQAAKMASLGELVAGVAHEINNPLAFTISHLATVQRCWAEVNGAVHLGVASAAGQSWERAACRLREMAVGLERIAALVVKLRTFSRLDEGERKTVSVRECVDSLLMMMSHRLTDRVSVEVHCGEPDLLDCYPSLLNQALMNLFANAVDAISGEGAVTIRTGQEGDTYRFAIADNGSGIAASVRDRVFEPFFTTKAVGEGTGLGLSITYAIVGKHGGTLELTNAEGGGTVATIRLPLAVSHEGTTC